MSKWRKWLTSSFYFQIARKNQNDNLAINFLCFTKQSFQRRIMWKHSSVYDKRKMVLWVCLSFTNLNVIFRHISSLKEKGMRFFVFVLFVFLSPSLFDWNLYEQSRIVRILSSPILQSWTWLCAIINLPFNFIGRVLKASWSVHWSADRQLSDDQNGHVFCYTHYKCKYYSP